MDNLELLGTARCGACHGKVERVNLLSLRHLATWRFPTHGNVLTGESGGAVAVVCDACIDHGGAVKEAVEVLDGRIVYHPIDTLAEGPPPQSYRLVHSPRGRQGIECLRCGYLSWDPDDVLSLFCPRCQERHQRAGT